MRKLCKGFILQNSQYFPLKGKNNSHIVPRQTIFSEPVELQPDFASESAFLSAGSRPSCVLLCDSSVADKQHDKDKWPRWFPNTGHSSKLCNLNPSLLRLCQQNPCDVWVKEEVVGKRMLTLRQSPLLCPLSFILSCFKTLLTQFFRPLLKALIWILWMGHSFLFPLIASFYGKLINDHTYLCISISSRGPE